MKELSIEEKAKAYDEAKARMSIAYNSNRCTIGFMNEIFPELKESEGENADEKIRKALIKLVTNHASMDLFIEYGIHLDEALSWLEKQGEQSSLNTKQEYLKGIKRVQEYQDLSDWEKKFDDIASMYAHNKNQEGYNESWYVKERAAAMLYHAKKELKKQDEHQYSNDNLPSFDEAQGTVIVEKQGEQKPAEEYNITGIGSKHAEGKLGEMIKNLKPVDEILEQKPAWSEEDERIYKVLLELIDSYSKGTIGGYIIPPNVERYAKWFKALKDRVLSQPKQEWSEENKEQLDRALYMMEQLDMTKSWNDVYNWLKSLKDKIQPQPKQEWSEEDEKMVRGLIAVCDEWTTSHSFYPIENCDMEKLKNWLKSLRPQNNWKPSEEHYELEEFAKIVRGNLTGISKSVQKLFEAKYLQLTGNKMYRGFKD